MKTTIGWTDFTINFYTWNCDKVSEGCKNCYAEALAKRNGQTFRGKPQWRENAVKELVKAPFGTAAFINSMSDTFHEAVPLAWIQRIFGYAEGRPDMPFLILTKRIQRAAELAGQLPWHPNIWLGTSVELQKWTPRIDVLKQIPAKGKFLSLEPLLGPIKYDFRGIDGVIVGGESGEQRRPFEKAWARSIRDQCAEQGVMFFFKQGGSYSPGRDRELDGRTHDDVPWRTESPMRAMF